MPKNLVYLVLAMLLASLVCSSASAAPYHKRGRVAKFFQKATQKDAKHVRR